MLRVESGEESVSESVRRLCDTGDDEAGDTGLETVPKILRVKAKRPREACHRSTVAAPLSSRMVRCILRRELRGLPSDRAVAMNSCPCFESHWIDHHCFCVCCEMAMSQCVYVQVSMEEACIVQRDPYLDGADCPIRLTSRPVKLS